MRASRHATRVAAKAEPTGRPGELALEAGRRGTATSQARHAARRGCAAWSLPRTVFFFSSRRRHTRLQGDWSSDVCSSDLDNSGRSVADAVGRVVTDAPLRQRLIANGYETARGRTLEAQAAKMMAVVAQELEIGRASCRERV